MGCLLCGKEIGPLRLLRDDEFCSSAHRKRYKDRLGRALTSISAPEPAPAGIAGFLTELQPLTGNCAHRAGLGDFGRQSHVIQFRKNCPVAVPPVLGNGWKNLAGVRAYSGAVSHAAGAGPIAAAPSRVPNLALDLLRDADPACATGDVPAPATAWQSLPAAAVEVLILPAVALQTVSVSPALSAGSGLPNVKRLTPGIAAAAPAPAPSEVQCWIEPAAALELVHAGVPLAPPFAIEAAPDMPEGPAIESAPVCERWMPVPAAGAVETLVAWSAAAEWMELPAPAICFRLALVPAFRPAARPGVAPSVAAPAPAPVESWIEAAATFDLAHTPGFAAPRFAFDAVTDTLPASVAETVEVVAACEQWAPAPMAAPVESWVTPAAAFDLAARAPELAAPRFAFEAVAFPEAGSKPVAVVAACERWMPVPAEGVASLVAWSQAGELAPAAALAAPRLESFSIGETFMPVHDRLARPKGADPAEVYVLPSHRAESLSAPQALVRGIDPTFDLAPDAASYVVGLPPQPVESLPARRTVQPAARNIVPITAIHQNGLPQASCSYGYTPARHAPVPVESLVFPTCRATFMATIEVTLPALVLHDSRPAFATAAAGVDSLPAARTVAAESRRPVVEPIRGLALLRPQTRHRAAALLVPAGGFSQLEFYCQRPTGSITRALELQGRRIEVVPPAFTVRPVFDRLDDEAAPQKKASKKLAMAEIFTMPEAKRKAAAPAVHYAVKGIAASLLLGAVLWFAAGTMRTGTRTAAVNRDVALVESADDSSDSSAPAATPSSPSQSLPAARGESAGAMARLRQALSKRAAATVTDSFGNGMEAWGTPAKAWAPGWSRHSEGYVQPGQLAFFRPSLNYADYRLEFFGQIDNKSMGWTVRSKDPKNYYAMKFSVVAPGLRPIIAMVHYSVVDGKKSRATSTPLNVMVHNNTPMQVAVDVKGSRMVTSIDGQEVDTWIDDTIPSGGVGFFADAGEKSRLYWMKVSKNEDFLGRVCAYLSSALGSGANASAGVWPPAAPGSAPLPGQPAPGGPREAAVAAAAVSFGSGRKFRGRVSKERFEPWNS